MKLGEEMKKEREVKLEEVEGYVMLEEEQQEQNSVPQQEMTLEEAQCQEVTLEVNGEERRHVNTSSGTSTGI